MMSSFADYNIIYSHLGFQVPVSIRNHQGTLQLLDKCRPSGQRRQSNELTIKTSKTEL